MLLRLVRKAEFRIDVADDSLACLRRELEDRPEEEKSLADMAEQIHIDIGYIIDRTGFEEYRKWALEGVELPAMAEVAQTMYWSGVRY